MRYLKAYAEVDIITLYSALHRDYRNTYLKFSGTPQIILKALFPLLRY